MLEISFRNGSYSDPLVGPKMVTRGCQTELPRPSATTSSTLSASVSAVASNSNEKSPSGKTPLGYSSGSKPAPDEVRPTSSLNGTSSTSCENLRPLSSASEDSEETSSISDDDEIIFNTIKRQVKKPGPDLILSGKNFLANNNGSPEDCLNSVGECDGEVAVNVAKSSTTEASNNVDGVVVADGGLLKVNGDSHLADCLADQQQKEVLSQS